MIVVFGSGVRRHLATKKTAVAFSDVYFHAFRSTFQSRKKGNHRFKKKLTINHTTLGFAWP